MQIKKQGVYGEMQPICGGGENDQCLIRNDAVENRQPKRIVANDRECWSVGVLRFRSPNSVRIPILQYSNTPASPSAPPLRRSQKNAPSLLVIVYSLLLCSLIESVLDDAGREKSRQHDRFLTRVFRVNEHERHTRAAIFL